MLVPVRNVATSQGPALRVVPIFTLLGSIFTGEKWEDNFNHMITIACLIYLTAHRPSQDFTPIGVWAIDKKSLVGTKLPGNQKLFTTSTFIEFRKDATFSIYHGMASGVWHRNGLTLTLIFTGDLSFPQMLHFISAGSKNQSKMVYLAGEKHFKWMIQTPKMKHRHPMYLYRLNPPATRN